jgi:hypothetical protein
MRKLVLLAGAMLATLVLIMAGPVSKQVLSPRPVEAQTSSTPVFVKNGPGVDNGAIQAAINDAEGQPVTILLTPDPKKCYSISGTIDLASNVTIDSADPPERWCMKRATAPATKNATELRWFRVIGNAVDNFTLRYAILDGRGPGDVSFEEQTAFVDIGLVFNQRISDPQDPSLYSKNLILEHVRFDKFYGACVFLKYVNGVRYDDVVCNDPTKGGLIFTYGTRNGTITNSESTLTGDDAMAFTSADAAPGGALVTNIDVQNAHLTQEQDDQGCGTLCFRGADDIVTTNSDIGTGSGVGTVTIARSSDPAHAFSSSNIKLSNSIIRPDADESGVFVTPDPGVSNIQITDNSIAYTPPQCGIRLASPTLHQQVTTGPNTFVPDDSTYNVCPPPPE